MQVITTFIAMLALYFSDQPAWKTCNKHEYPICRRQGAKRQISIDFPTLTLYDLYPSYCLSHSFGDCTTVNLWYPDAMTSDNY